MSNIDRVDQTTLRTTGRRALSLAPTAAKTTDEMKIMRPLGGRLSRNQRYYRISMGDVRVFPVDQSSIEKQARSMRIASHPVERH